MNRVIPSFVEDARFNDISPYAEIFFRRLWNEADDYGRFDGRLKIIKSRLYPLKDIRLSDIGRYIKECEKASLIMCYEVNENPYICITKNWNQSLKRANPKYPAPEQNPEIDRNLNTVDCNLNTVDCLKRRRKEEEKKQDIEGDKSQDIFSFLPNEFDCSQFRQAWSEWLEYRKERKFKNWVTQTLKKNAKIFSEWGVEATISNIDYSIKSGWQGIFEKKTPPSIFENNPPEKYLIPSAGR